MAGIISNTPGFVQFENANENRSYPFADNSTLVSRTGEELPVDVISDMHLAIPSSVEKTSSGTEERAAAYLSSVHMSTAMLSACVTLVSSKGVSGALSVTVRMSEFRPYTPYRMTKLAGTEDAGGMITFGSFEVPMRPVTYFFDMGAAAVCESCITRLDPPRLRRFYDPRSGLYASGDVGIEFSDFVDTKRDGSRVRLLLRKESADALASTCERERAVNGCGSTPVMKINGVMPDDKKRIVLWFH